VRKLTYSSYAKFDDLARDKNASPATRANAAKVAAHLERHPEMFAAGEAPDANHRGWRIEEDPNEAYWQEQARKCWAVEYDAEMARQGGRRGGP
jgi:hypothetical protein